MNYKKYDTKSTIGNTVLLVIAGHSTNQPIGLKTIFKTKQYLF